MRPKNAFPETGKTTRFEFALTQVLRSDQRFYRAETGRLPDSGASASGVRQLEVAAFVCGLKDNILTPEFLRWRGGARC